jgi:phage shock protein C
MGDGQMNKLYRSKNNKMIAGVCGGIGEYFKIDPTLVRLLWLLISLMSVGGGVVAYIIAWIIVPQEP